MKILMLASEYPFPVNSGDRRRNSAMLEHLARRHDVTVVASRCDRGDDDAAAARPWRAHLVAGNRPKLAAASRSTFTTATYRQARFCTPALGRAATHLLATEQFDVVWAAQIDMAALLVEALRSCGSCDPSPVLVLDQHNEEEWYWRTLRRSLSSAPRRAFATIEVVKARRLQRRLFPQFDAILAVSDEDRARTLRYGVSPARVVTVPNGVDVRYFEPRREQPDRAPDGPRRIVFGGSLQTTMNHDAVMWFVTAVLPRIERQVSVEVVVVGRGPGPALRRLERPGVRIVGEVDDVRPWYADADVFVVPVRSGGGTKLKTVEAMAMALPIVSTSIGVQGLDVQRGRELFVADDADAFAARVVELVRDPTLAAQLGRSARARVEASYSWPTITGIAEAVIARARNDRSDAPPRASER